jgi:thiosulfate/3-mercaptopyruvate sulfurtransferase
MVFSIIMHILDTVIDVKSLYNLIKSHDPNLLIIDTRPFSDYVNDHIPGALNLDFMNFHWLDTTKGGIIQFNKQMKILINYLGINSNNFVVFYDDISGYSASRGVWLLHYFSHRNVYILDGGYKYWSKLNYPVEKKTNSNVVSEVEYKINKEVLADAEYIKKRLEKKTNDMVIIDCRSEMEYRGTIARASKKGHIPQAINIDWINNLAEEKFKDSEKLDQLYSFIPKDKEVITYCHGGYRAANTYLILKKLGYSDVKMYLGSWGEWGNIHEFPVE